VSDARDLVDEPRALLRKARRVVVKVGSRLLQDSPVGRPAAVADELARLRRERGIEAVVVTSGAISLGMRTLGIAERPRDLARLQAAAAVGQRQLAQVWEHAFSAHQLVTGQILLTHDDLGDRTRFLNARRALRALIDAGAVPIVNENDTVAVDEIKYGDNDMLAAMMGNLISADAVVIFTDVDGLHDGPPDAGGTRIPIVRDVEREAVPVAQGTSRGSPGSGGMASKVAAARTANRHGIAAVVVPGRDPQALERTLSGADIGTLFVPPGDRITSRKHWIAYGSRPSGTITVDAGARKALETKGTSLLPIGVLDITGSFGVGHMVSVLDATGTEFARGLTSYGADELRAIKGCRSTDIESALGYKYVDEVIHRDDLVLL